MSYPKHLSKDSPTWRRWKYQPSSPKDHLPTCTKYCARVHCQCGRDARHGSKFCGTTECGQLLILLANAERSLAKLNSSPVN